MVHNKVDELFARLKTENRAALIPYITCGFPHEEVTRKLLPVLADSGADLIELGVPFSDPIADGPIIQRSSTVALEAGMTFLKVISILKEFRKKYDTPVILFGALNPYLARGLNESARLAEEAGAQGILAADLPFDESDEFRDSLEKRNQHLITLVAPTTPLSRLRQISADSSGFLYCISMMGTTGQLSGLATSTKEYLQRLREATKLPLALGFGISQPAHVRAAVDLGADAVVVGSSLITLIEKTSNEGGSVEQAVGGYIRSLAGELKRS